MGATVTQLDQAIARLANAMIASLAAHGDLPPDQLADISRITIERSGPDSTVTLHWGRIDTNGTWAPTVTQWTVIAPRGSALT